MKLTVRLRPVLPRKDPLTSLEANALTQRSIQQLLVDGANEHELPRSYQKYLGAVPSYTKRLSRLEDLGARLFLLGLLDADHCLDNEAHQG
jgi:hypothetical protein